MKFPFKTAHTCVLCEFLSELCRSLEICEFLYQCVLYAHIFMHISSFQLTLKPSAKPRASSFLRCWARKICRTRTTNTHKHMTMKRSIAKRARMSQDTTQLPGGGSQIKQLPDCFQIRTINKKTLKAIRFHACVCVQVCVC